MPRDPHHRVEAAVDVLAMVVIAGVLLAMLVLP